MTSTGTPSTSPPKKSMKPRPVTIWVRRLAMISARPRAAASIASVAMNGDDPAVGDQHPVDQAAAGADRERGDAP